MMDGGGERSAVTEVGSSGGGWVDAGDGSPSVRAEMSPVRFSGFTEVGSSGVAGGVGGADEGDAGGGWIRGDAGDGWM